MVDIIKNKCTGCGICANLCPEGIEMSEGKARIKNENVDCLKDVVSACPRGAIIFNGENSNNQNINTEFNQDYNQGRGQGGGSGQGMGGGMRDGRGQGMGGGGNGRRGMGGGRGGGGRRKW